MNILFITKNDWLRSVVYDLHILAEGLSLQGHQVYAIDLVGVRKGEVKNVARAFPGAKVELRRADYISPLVLPTLGTLSIGVVPGLSYVSRTITRIYSAITCFLEIRRTIKNKNIDAIVLYSAVNESLWSIRLARWFHIPIVFRNIDMLYNLELNPRERDAVKALEKKVYPKMDALFALTPKYAEYLVKMGAPEAKVTLLLFPLDLSLFRPGVDSSDIRQKWGFTEKDKVIVFVGTLYEFGGLAELIRQFPEVIKHIPEAKLVIVGDGPLRPKLDEIISMLGLEKQVIITGYQPFQTLPQYINIAAICINAFPIADNTKDLFSAKIIQYLACGKATISTSLPGITTLLPGESCGVIYADSTTDMVSKIVNLLGSAERRGQLGQAGLDYVKRNHSYDKIVFRLETVLREVITGKPK